MKRRIIALFMVLTLMFAFSGCGKSASDKKIKTTVKDITASAGDIISVPVVLAENPGMIAAQPTIIYDGDMFEFMNYTNGNIFDECTAESTVVEEEDIVKAVLFREDLSADTKATGTVVSLRFKVKDTAKKGTYTFKVAKSATAEATNEEVKKLSVYVNSNEQYVDPTIQLPKITVK